MKKLKKLWKEKKEFGKNRSSNVKQQKNQETFTPVINHRRGDNGERRNLNQFLNDQKNFSEKVQKKRENILNKNEEERNKENVGKKKLIKILKNWLKN